MTEPMPTSLRPFYADWAGYNRRTIDGIRRITAEELAFQMPGTDHWPIWAIFGHAAGTRVYWLCRIFGEPGAEATPFRGDDEGWEDDLSTPRSSAELAGAYESTWTVIDGVLGRWPPESLDVAVERAQADRQPERHTRQSILLRLMHHEAYHLGEVNVILGANGREMIDPWPATDWLADAPRELREGRRTHPT
jgi:uncharacterized damage-inducible protein DinB